MNEGPFCVHEIELVVQSRPGVGNRSCVREHTQRSSDLSKVRVRHDCGRLVVDADLEASRAPVDELHGASRLDTSDGGVSVLWHHVPAVQKAARHVLACSRIALDELSARLEASIGQLGDRKRLVERFFGRDDRRICRQREVDSRVRNQVRLELIQIHVERALEPQRSRDRGDNLSDDSIEVAVRRALDA